MKPKTFMLIAGEASGDLLAAELVRALREECVETGAAPTPDFQPLHSALEPRFFGAGGPLMAEAGAELAFDMTEHSVIGLSDVLKNYFKFKRLFHQLLELAIERQPDAIVCVDFSGFNRRFAHAIKEYVRRRLDWFHPWNPKIVQYVSPQVWASREGRARQLARDYDLVLSIFPFEEEWYAKRVPQLRVEFVGHPMVDRFQKAEGRRQKAEISSASPLILLLPGSRPDELRRHLPVMLGALKLIHEKIPASRVKMVLPDDPLIQRAKAFGVPPDLDMQAGKLPEALMRANLAIASTGTVTMECAFFGVPAVAIYKTSWSTYQIAKRIVKVKYLAMPNLLAGEEIFPEFIQDAATPENISRAALELLQNESRRAQIKTKLAEIVSSLGGPGASRRAASAILRLFE
jgi:lipid-A-disaccharide synthase